MKLTDTDALRKAVRDDPDIDGLTYARVMRHIIEAKREDAVPVVHGRWIDRTKNIRGFYDYRYDCSVCEHIFWHGGIENFNYCPNCGAKMDGDGNG